MDKIRCEQCGREFEVKPSVKDTARFCSRECYGKYKAKDEKKEEIRELRKEGKTWKEIKEQTGVSDTVVRRYVKGIKPYKWSPNWVEIPKSSKKLTKEKVRIIAHLCGDGNLSGNNINYSNTNGVLTEQFCEDFKSVFNYEPTTKVRKQGDRDLNIVFCGSKKIAEDLRRYQKNSYRHDEWRICKEIVKNKELAKTFLRTLYSDEGWMSGSQIGIRLKNEKALKQISKILSSLSVENRPNTFTLHINKQDSIVVFYEEIGFTEGVKISGRDKGKQEVLGEFVNEIRNKDKNPRASFGSIKKGRKKIAGLLMKNKNITIQDIKKKLNLDFYKYFDSKREAKKFAGLGIDKTVGERIIDLLKGSGKMTTTEISEALNKRRQHIFYDLKKLKENNGVKVEKPNHPQKPFMWEIE